MDVVMSFLLTIAYLKVTGILVNTHTPPTTNLFIRLNMSTHRVIELNCNDLPFSIRENERFPRWVDLAKQRTNTSTQCRS